MVSEKLRIDPHSPAYEAARAEMVEVLRQIGREDSRNGYTQMADDLAAGNRAEVPTWIALALMAARAPADLRSALEAEREADAFLVEWQQGGEMWVHAHADEPTAVDQARKKGGTCTPLYRALAPTKEPAAGTVLMPAQATREMIDAADACTDAYEAYGKMVEVGRVR